MPFSLRSSDVSRWILSFQIQCLDEIQQQYDALMAEGILPASAPPPTPPSKPEKRAKPTDDGGGTGEGVGSGGEPDPDLELDDDVAAARYDDGGG